MVTRKNSSAVQATLEKHQMVLFVRDIKQKKLNFFVKDMIQKYFSTEKENIKEYYSVYIEQMFEILLECMSAGHIMYEYSVAELTDLTSVIPVKAYLFMLEDFQNVIFNMPNIDEYPKFKQEYLLSNFKLKNILYTL